MMIKEVCDSEEKKLITKRILDNLPEWFEQENQKEMYINREISWSEIHKKL